MTKLILIRHGQTVWNKLVIVNHSLNQRHRFELRYFITEGHLDRWVYSTPGSSKRIETDFAAAACNPA